jgi:hypothetical protein
MNINEALRDAKRNDEEKVGLNIKVPVSLKNDFERVCREKGVSMTSMMLSLIKLTVRTLEKEKIDPVKVQAQIVELEEYFEDFEYPESPEEEREFYKKQYELQKLKELLAGGTK